jgi:DNA primase
MAGRIPRDFIDDLIARTDIVDIVDSRVKLKKAGKNYQACCPFHNEKSPSFTVSAEKQFYHCFGCGEHGNALSFIMEFDRLEFVEAIEELAGHHSIEVPRDQSSQPFNKAASQQKKQQLENDFELMEKAAQFFQQQLKRHANSDKVITYLKDRGLSGAIVKSWEMGYAPPEWQALADTLGTSPERIQQCVDLKIMTQNDNGKRYDFFRDRLMFPIRDKRGRVIGFGGRVIDADQGPKYLNSPETRIFFKGSELYGLHRARNMQRHIDRIVVVEGYMDVVALSQFDINYAVASLGTATTPEHVQLMLRNTDEIVCCYDGDKAGRGAAWRTMENALPLLKDGKAMKFLFLPDGEDPDTMVRQIGKDALEEQFANAMPLSKFLFENLLQRHNVASVEGKAALRAEAEPLIASVAGDIQKEILQGELSKLLGEYDRFQLERDINKANNGPRKMANPGSGSPQKLSQTPVRMLIRLLVEHPSLAQTLPKVNPVALADAGLPGLDFLIELHQFCSQQTKANTASVFEYFREHAFAKHLHTLLAQEWLITDDDINTVYVSTFKRLVDQFLTGQTEALIAKSRNVGLSDEEKYTLKKLLTKN